MRSPDELDQLWRDGLAESAPRPTVKAPELVVANVARRRRNRVVARSSGVAALVAFVGLAATLAMDVSRPAHVDVSAPPTHASSDAAVPTPTTAHAGRPNGGAVPPGGVATQPSGRAPRGSDPQPTTGDTIARGSSPSPAPPDTTPRAPAVPVDPPADGVAVVAVVLDDSGLRATASVPFGVVRVSFVDLRSRPKARAALSFEGTSIASGDAKQFTLGIDRWVVTAIGPGLGRPRIPTASFDTVPPSLGPPHESASHLTVRLTAGGLAPTVRRLGHGVPYLEGHGGPNSLPWTTMQGGEVVIRVENPDHLDRMVHIAGKHGRWRIRAKQDYIEFGLTLNPRADNTYRIYTLANGAPVDAEQLVLWMD